MSTYKVIQDIEAEDKLLGPLTLRQFIYAAIVAVSGFICFKLLFSSVWWLIIAFLPHMILFATLAAPFGHDQPSEVWLLAKIRFFLKPRRRIWDQSGMKELVTITAPKHVEKQLTNNLSQSEVKSRLKALATTIDSRGWATKNVNAVTYATPAYGPQANTSDRLIDVSTLPQEVPSFDTQAVSDMFDEQNNPVAQNFDSMVAASTKAHRQEVMSMMQQASELPATQADAIDSGAGSSTKTKTKKQRDAEPPPDYWFMNGDSDAAAMYPGYARFDHNPVVSPGVDNGQPVVNNPLASNVAPVDEAALLEHIHKEQSRPNPMNSHIRTIQPLSHPYDNTFQQPSDPATNDDSATTDTTDTAVANTASTLGALKTAPEPMAPPRDPAILELASNDDLNVATLARQANKARQVELSSDDEVVISLH